MDPSFPPLELQIRAFYARTWAAWFKSRPDLSMADLKIELVGEGSSASINPHFSLSRNEIYLPVLDGDLENYADQQFREDNLFGEWQTWKMELVHEMLHEWQQKKPCTPSARAAALNKNSKKHFSGQGHGDDFYQAIVDQAPYFSMTPEQLEAAI